MSTKIEQCPHHDTVCRTECILWRYLDRPVSLAEPATAVDTWLQCPDYDMLIDQYADTIEESRKYLGDTGDAWIDELRGE